MTPSETRPGYRDHLHRLEDALLDGLVMVADTLATTMKALKSCDMEMAEQVVANDYRIDELYQASHQDLLSLVALESPVATDLRVVAALLHTARHIERMGDQCVNICKLIPVAGHTPPVNDEILRRVLEMGERARVQVLAARAAFAERSMSQATELVRSDIEINRLNREIFGFVLEAGPNFDEREWATLMLMVARCLERVGDNAVDVGEHVGFIVTGEFQQFSDASTPKGADASA